MQDTSSKISRRYARSSSFLMALLFTLLCGATALALGYFITSIARGYLIDGVQSIIDSEVKYIEALDELPRDEPGRIHIRLDDEGTLPPMFASPDRTLAVNLTVFRVIDDTGMTYYATRIHTMPDGRLVLVGANITSTIKDFNLVKWIGIGGIVFTMIVVFASYLISIFVVRGTNTITDTAYQIMHTGDLTRRVEVKSRWDDLSHMASILNRMLDRIEELMNATKQVSDNIAHDLRTPLSNMRGHIESLAGKNGKNRDFTKLLEETDRILETFNALLRIARIESEQLRANFTEISLDEILSDVIDFYEPLAEEKEITIVREISPVKFHCDRDLLFQTIANIMDNAVKYTSPGGTITLGLDEEAGHIRMAIENTGDSIPDDELEKIFDRFFRIDKSRHETGLGLGLSLTRAVVGLHGGRITAENTETGIAIITDF